MNRTVIFVTFSVLAALGIGGTLVLLIHRPDASATFTAFIITILGLVSVAAAQFYGFGKVTEKAAVQTEKLETIERNTNGRLHARDEQIKYLTEILIARGIDPNEDEPKHAA